MIDASTASLSLQILHIAPFFQLHVNTDKHVSYMIKKTTPKNKTLEEDANVLEFLNPKVKTYRVLKSSEIKLNKLSDLSIVKQLDSSTLHYMPSILKTYPLKLNNHPDPKV